MTNTGTFDASLLTGTATINANLVTQSVVINTGITGLPPLTLGVTGIGNVIGTANNDTITGNDHDNNLAGGNGDDILTGNGGNDTVSGGTGNDTLIGGTGNDSLDGGTGNDTADYSAIGQAITLKQTGVVTKGTAGTDQLVNVENIIGATGRTNIIDASTATGTATINVNLATNSVVFNNAVFVIGPSVSVPTLTFGVTNFATVIGTVNNDTIAGDNGNNTLIGNAGNDILTGNGGNDTVSGGNGNDTLVGGIGNDSLDGGANTDTADYSAIGQAITLLPTGTVTKGTAGTDQLVNVENIIGATGLTNIIDASTATGTATINANLATNSVVFNNAVFVIGPSVSVPTLTFGVTNFSTVIGTVNNDTIAGDNANNTLIGNAGNDTLNGGGGNDQIFGDVTSAITAPIFTYNGKFYFLSSAGSWTQAQAQAVSLGGNLVAVNDAAENQFLVNTFGGTERLWIGLTDEVTEGTFKWVNGEAVTYTNWYPNEPNNSGGNENYAEFNLLGAGKWNDLPNSLVFLRGIIEIANSNDTIIGSTGNDTINGGIGQDTADYSAIGQAITLLPTGTVTKGTAGTDQLVNVENIIGATGLTNIIDASTATGTATINANLATKSLVVNTGVIAFPTLTFGVTNFATVIGTANNDTLTGDDGNNTLIGNGGNDILTGNGGNDTVSGGTGNDAINGGLGSDTVDYSSFTEAITLLASGIVNKGSFGTDTIVGVETVIGATGQSNTIDASTGTATTTSLNVNLGNNSLIVNGLPAPINSITLNVQNFLNVYGTTQNDTITGNNLSNLLAGNAGNDTIQGNDGDDGLFGGDGNDSLLGGVGQDVLLGEFGNDFLFGEVGNDLLFGDDGNDQLYGGDGLDELYGGIGADSLYGGNDNDVLWGEDGNDILNGGNGNDIFVIARGSADIVQDFQDGFDRIGLGGGLLFSQLTISSLGTNTLIRSSGQILATLQNVSSTLITSTDFTVV
jgi:Ca2+-binding RTX toxin-like protein